jgi:type III secretion protein Q
MKTLDGLRCVDSATQQRGHTAAALRSVGYQPQLDIVLTDARYLKFGAVFCDQSEMTGYVDVAQWMSQSLPSLEGMDWSSIDDRALPALVQACPVQLDLLQLHATVTGCQVNQIVDNTLPLQHLPRVATATGWILVEQFEPGTGAKLVGNDVIPAVPVTVDFNLGTSFLSLRQLSGADVGDVLLINNVALHMRSHGAALLTYILQEDSIMISDPIEYDGDFGYDPHKDQIQVEDLSAPIDAAHTKRQKFADLPIELSFVLLEKSVTLTELQKMAPGEIVQLPQDQLLHVEIRANRRTFAQGELVQLSDGQIGVEIHSINA